MHASSRAPPHATSVAACITVDRHPYAPHPVFRPAVVRCRSSKSLPGDLLSATHNAPLPAAVLAAHRRTEHAAPRRAAPGGAGAGAGCSMDDASGCAAGFDAGYDSDADDTASILPRCDATYHHPLEAHGFAAGFALGAPPAGHTSPAPAGAADPASILGRVDCSYGCPLEAAGFADGFESGCDSDADDCSILNHPGRMYDCPLEAAGFAEGFESA